MVKDTIALQKLKQRLDNQPKKIDNGKLHAGAPMYFYCQLCGHECDRLPESYISPPKKHCAPCRELMTANPEITPSTLVELANAQ